jgi:uncharacterized protein (DUF433 family)
MQSNSDRPEIEPLEILKSFLAGASVDSLAEQYQLRVSEIEAFIRLGFKMNPSALYL